MRKTLLLSAVALGFTAGTALAQSGTMTSPPTGTQTMPSQMMTQGNPDLRPGHIPGVGLSYPASSQASNINSRDVRSDIAPRLPSPAADPGAGPDHYIHVAEHALRRRQTGEAQQAIEMAETRLLDRSVLATEVNAPAQNPAVSALEAARQDLARHDFAGAQRHLGEALTQSASAMGMSTGGASSMAAPGNMGAMGNGPMGNNGMSSAGMTNTGMTNTGMTNTGMSNGGMNSGVTAPPSPASTPPGMSEGLPTTNTQ